MTKQHQFRFFIVSCVLAAVSFLLGACLNPVAFNADNLPTLKTKIEGTVQVNINDVAVMWLINRTKTVNVTNFTITRPKLSGETANEYIYPKVYTGNPLAGNSLASYHTPSETPYSVTIEWTDGGTPGTWTKEGVQFPRAADYKFYLYRTAADKVIVVDENEMKQESDPDDTSPPPPVSPIADTQTFVVINVTPDQNLDEVEFVKDSNHFVMSREPRAKDQQMLLLGAGSYATTARYTRSSASLATTQKNIIVTKEPGSMAVRTNFVYFYKTKSNDYQLSQTWPPIPDDASDENRVEDALLEGQGILRIINKAIPGQAHPIISRIKINNIDYPDSTYTGPYMIFDDSRDYILDAGTVHVAFKPQDQEVFGMIIPREIFSKRITTLVYTGDLANPDSIPPGTGYGSGLIRITNQSQGIVYGSTVFMRADLSKSMIYGYEDFTPPSLIQRNDVGRIPVVGNTDFHLVSNEYQLIQVYLDTSEGPVSIERLASINGRIIDILITNEELDKKKRIGSRVKVENLTTSPTLITSVQVYNKENENISIVYGLDVSNPNSQEIYVLSGTGFPIVPDGRYAAKITVYGNGIPAIIRKEFTGGEDLYSITPESHLRTVTLNESDLPTNLRFYPINKITVDPYFLRAATTYTTHASDQQQRSITAQGILNFNAIPLVFDPSNASRQSPVTWTTTSTAFVTISNNVLTVRGIPAALKDNETVAPTIQVTATVPGGLAGGADYVTDFTVTLPYEDRTTVPPSSTPVINIDLTTPSPIAIGQALSLPPLAKLTPQGAHRSDGTPITTDDISWTITSGTGGSISSDGTFTATASGEFWIKATLLTSLNANGPTISDDVEITVNPPPTLILRIIMMNKSDSVSQIALVPANRSSDSISGHSSPFTVWQTGYTAEKWAEGYDNPTWITKNRFANRWVNTGITYTTVDLPKGEWKYRDVAVPYPPAGKTGYYLFFIEGDSRVRGYCNPGKLDPPIEDNFLFYLHADALSPIWLDSNNYQRAQGTTGATPVIPISYHTTNNVSSIMKSAGVGNKPTYKISF